MTRSRRGHFEGSVYERKRDGKWVAVVSLGFNAAGKRRRKVQLADTKKEALDLLRILQAKHLGGESIDPKRRSLGLIADEFLIHLKASTAPGTWRGVDVSWRLHLKPHVAHVIARDFTPAHARRVFDDLQRLKTGTSAQLQAFKALRRIFKFAIEKLYVARSPLQGIPAPKHEPGTHEVWSFDEAKQFIELARDEPFYAGCVLALAAGLRAAEIRGLRWRDVDLKGHTLTVRQQSSAHDGIRPPKTKSSRRTIALPSIAVDVLKAHRAKQAKIAEYVFSTSSGEPIDQGSQHRWWKKAAAVAKVTPIRFHDLRHSTATFLIASGEPANVVAEILGHRDASITMRVYSHVLAPMREHAASTLNSILRGEPMESHRGPKADTSGDKPEVGTDQKPSKNKL